jgi:DNA-binding FadR family transcriptional regulator
LDTLSILREHLSEGLAEGFYEMGKRIPPERDLAELFGTSRSSVREALSVLEIEKQVIRKVGRGTYIAPEQSFKPEPSGNLQFSVSPAELMMAREVFEPALLKLVVLNATDRDIRKLRHLGEKLKAAEPGRDFEAGDVALHRAIAAAARNPLLMDLSEQILRARETSDWRKLKASVARRKPQRRVQVLAEHERIIRAIEDRDADEASVAMRAHLESVKHNLIETQN